MHVIYTPIYLYWLYLSFKARAFLFFSAANPGIELGGFLGDSKMGILDKIPNKWIPNTLFVSKETPFDTLKENLIFAGISYPVIAKPDIGERGFLVEKINNEAELKQYVEAHPINWIVQEYIDYPEEISILYYRFPHEKSGHITSVTLKKYLTIEGDGISTVKELVLAYPRAKLQLPVLEKSHSEMMGTIPAAGEKIELVPIGNHSRGTTFLNGNHLIDERLLATFDAINRELEEIYFGRFDIKCKSMESLKSGVDFCILEINGVKSEPTHIYEPGFSIWEAYKVLFSQWRIIYEISMANKARGVDFVSLREGLHQVKIFAEYKRTAAQEIGTVH